MHCGILFIKTLVEHYHWQKLSKWNISFEELSDNCGYTAVVIRPGTRCDVYSYPLRLWKVLLAKIEHCEVISLSTVRERQHKRRGPGWSLDHALWPDHFKTACYGPVEQLVFTCWKVLSGKDTEIRSGLYKHHLYGPVVHNLLVHTLHM